MNSDFRETATDGNRYLKIELAQLCKLSDSVPDPVVIVNPELKIACWNTAATECFGYGPDETVGRPVSEFFTDPAAECRGRFEELASGEESDFAIETVLKRRDGREFRAAVSVCALQLPDGPWGVGTVRDITASMAAQDALRKSEARYRSLIENTPDLVMVFDWDGRILYANRSTDAVPVESLAGTKALSHLAPRYREAATQTFRKVRRTGIVQQIEVESIHDHTWLCRMVPMPPLGGERSIMVICSDITDHRRAQQVLDQGHERLRRVLEMQERERRLVAYEIHDGVAQPIAAALMSLESLIQTVEKLRPREMELLRSVQEMLRDAMTDSRCVMRGLRSPVLDEFGLKTALENLVQEVETRSGMEIQFSWNIETKELAGPLETTIYRIVQEGLTNAMLHSQSDQVRLDVFEQKGIVRIAVEDRGMGFDVDSVEPGRFGLEGIHHRARVFGGKAVIKSKPGEGTLLQVELPIVKQ